MHSTETVIATARAHRLDLRFEAGGQQGAHRCCPSDLALLSRVWQLIESEEHIKVACQERCCAVHHAHRVAALHCLLDSLDGIL